MRHRRSARVACCQHEGDGQGDDGAQTDVTPRTMHRAR
jgi:hypothetical protein